MTYDIRIMEIYADAYEKITGEKCIYDNWLQSTLRKFLVDQSDGIRQTREARIARRALKEAAYARLGQ